MTIINYDDFPNKGNPSKELEMQCMQNMYNAVLLMH